MYCVSPMYGVMLYLRNLQSMGVLGDVLYILVSSVKSHWLLTSARMRSEGYGSRSVCLCVCLHLFSCYRHQTGSRVITTALAQQALEK